MTHSHMERTELRSQFCESLKLLVGQSRVADRKRLDIGSKIEKMHNVVPPCMIDLDGFDKLAVLWHLGVVAGPFVLAKEQPCVEIGDPEGIPCTAYTNDHAEVVSCQVTADEVHELRDSKNSILVDLGNVVAARRGLIFAFPGT